MVIYSDYILHSGEFFSSLLSKLWIFWAVAAIVDVAVFIVTTMVVVCRCVFSTVLYSPRIYAEVD